MRLITNTILLLVALRFSNASPSKVKANMHIREELGRDHIITEVSQLVSKHKNHRILPIYKLVSQNLRTSTTTQSSPISSKWMKIDPKTGTVRFKRSFDRDVECGGSNECVIEAEVVVTPHKIFQLIELQIVIDDINDNKPLFPLQTLVLNVSESLSEGDTINLDAYQATDKDFGRNAHLRYSMTSNKYFRLKHIIDGNNSSHLTLLIMKRPDRELTSEMELDIWARDAGSPVMVGGMKLMIKITDTNDNSPKFERDVYSTTLQENAPAGTIIAEVKATDADGGLFGTVRYRVSPRNKPAVRRLVRLDPIQGTVFLKEALDREKHDGIKVLIDALDSDPQNPKIGEAWLKIKVKDVNDNSPVIAIEFISQSRGDIVYVSESAPNGSYIAKLLVSDDDGGRNGETNVTLTSTAVSSNHEAKSNGLMMEYFSLSDGGFLVNCHKFDRETCSRYRVQIKACDNGVPERCSRKEIAVVILDENEFSPAVEEPLLYLKLPEDMYLGSEIASIVAKDGDNANGYALTRNETGDIVTSHNGDVTFSIVEGDFGLFSIGKKNGIIRLVAPLDREKRSEMKLTISARDGGYPPLESSCTIIVTIEDVNDNAPVFLNPSVDNAQIPADITSKKVITRIQAKDFDAGSNGKVTYYIVRHASTTKEGSRNYQNDLSRNSTPVDSYFILNPVSGDLRLNFSKENMSNFVGVHTLRIRAKDSGQVSRFTDISLRIAVGESATGHTGAAGRDISSSSVNFLVLATSLGCATALLIFLIIGVVIKCRRMNREINNMSKMASRGQHEKAKWASKVAVASDPVSPEIEPVGEESERMEDAKSEQKCSSEKVPDGTFKTHSNVQVTLDSAGVPQIYDNDSGKGESDIEAASLLVNETKVCQLRQELGKKCTGKCRIYGHSDECWMPGEGGSRGIQQHFTARARCAEILRLGKAKTAILRSRKGKPKSERKSMLIRFNLEY